MRSPISHGPPAPWRERLAAPAGAGGAERGAAPSRCRQAAVHAPAAGRRACACGCLACGCRRRAVLARRGREAGKLGRAGGGHLAVGRVDGHLHVGPAALSGRGRAGAGRRAGGQGTSPSAGLMAICTLDPPHSTPISRMMATDASRRRWYSLSVSVCAAPARRVRRMYSAGPVSARGLRVRSGHTGAPRGVQSTRATGTAADPTRAQQGSCNRSGQALQRQAMSGLRAYSQERPHVKHDGRWAMGGRRA